MLTLAAIFSITSSLGYALPAIIGLESMGVPSPGETALVLAAVLASQGKLQIELVILIGIASAIVGDNAGYLLGRRFGRDVLSGPGPFRHHRVEVIAAGDRFFERHGPKAVFLARWIALVRFAAAWLAGINGMRFRQFFFWNALGGITWAVTYGLVGYFLGSAAAHVIEKFGVYGLVALVVLAMVGFGVIRLRERRAKRRLGEPEGANSDGSGNDVREDPGGERPSEDPPSTDGASQQGLREGGAPNGSAAPDRPAADRRAPG